MYSSLQEIAPLSYAFIGGSFLNSYINRFESALNLAAEQFSSPSPSSTAANDQQPQQKQTYSRIRFKNVGYTAIALFARESGRVHHVREAEVGFGAAEMGNKGAVGLRLEYHGEGGETTLTFVATHLAAMEWNLSKRNDNWASIMRCMTFGDPAQIKAGESDGDEQGLLLADETTLQDISIFNPASHLFVGGDLNYRISAESPAPGAAFPSMDADSEDYYPKFFERDQLTQERRAGRTMHGLTEENVTFAPTYKYDVEDDGSEPVKWKFAAHRYPSWTDRILYLDLPPWVKAAGKKMHVRAYDSLPVLRTSDHRPVYLRVDVPLVGAAEMRAPEGVAEGKDDPRVTMPVAIDSGAWERREAAKRKEVMLGWSTLLWSTREGAVVVGTFLVATMGAYWFFFRA